MSCGQPCWNCGEPIPPERHKLDAMHRVFCKDGCMWDFREKAGNGEYGG